MATWKVQAKETDIVEIHWVNNEGKILVVVHTMPMTVDKTKNVFRATEK